LSTHLLTPAMAGLLDRIRRAGRPPLHQLTPGRRRARLRSRRRGAGPAARAAARVEDLSCPAATASRARRACTPLDERCRCCCTCTAAASSSAASRRTTACAASWRCAAAAPWWRWTTGWRPSTVSGRGGRHLGRAARWLAAHAERWAWTPRAGRGRRQRRRHAGRGGALHARDEGLPLALQLLITPGTAAHADTPSHRLFANGFLLDAAAIAWFFDHYIPYHHRRDWRFAPLLADDLDGVAPACVILAECDPLVDEGLAYADRCAPPACR
jgi:acetyl esterase